MFGLLDVSYLGTVNSVANSANESFVDQQIIANETHSVCGSSFLCCNQINNYICFLFPLIHGLFFGAFSFLFHLLHALLIT
jgi:hypothetical protein